MRLRIVRLVCWVLWSVIRSPRTYDYPSAIEGSLQRFMSFFALNLPSPDCLITSGSIGSLYRHMLPPQTGLTRLLNDDCRAVQWPARSERPVIAYRDLGASYCRLVTWVIHAPNGCDDASSQSSKMMQTYVLSRMARYWKMYSSFFQRCMFPILIEACLFQGLYEDT